MSADSIVLTFPANLFQRHYPGNMYFTVGLQPCCYTSDHAKADCMWGKPKEIAGYESNGFEISFYKSDGATATTGIEGWKKSHGHNQVIINEGTWKQVKWKAIGIGIYKEYAVVWFGELEDKETISNCQ